MDLLLAIEISKAAPLAKMPKITRHKERAINDIEKAKERVIEIEAEIDKLEKSKHRTYINCLACLSTKEPVLKLPSLDPEFPEE